MTRKIALALQEYESLVHRGKITSFTVTIADKGIHITAASAGADAKEIPLIEEMADTLRTFFYDAPAIEYGSYDYTSLNSFFHDPGEGA